MVTAYRSFLVCALLQNLIHVKSLFCSGKSYRVQVNDAPPSKRVQPE